MDTRFCLLIGFDRSGTSFCSQLLAEHPDIECFIQPFSSTIVHDSEWTLWSPEESYPEVEDFIFCLEKGHIKHSFLESDWFEKHSSTSSVRDRKLHIIKSTKLHHKIDWFRNQFPDLEIWGIHRNIKGILCSLFRNNFYKKWYGDEEFRRFKKNVTQFNYPSDFLNCVEQARSDLEKMTCMASGRIWSMYQSLSKQKILQYEQLLEDPTKELQPIMDYYNLDPIDFSSHLNKNYNIVGKQPAGKEFWKTYFSGKEKRTIEHITSSLF